LLNNKAAFRVKRGRETCRPALVAHLAYACLRHWRPRHLDTQRHGSTVLERQLNRLIAAPDNWRRAGGWRTRPLLIPPATS